MSVWVSTWLVSGGQAEWAMWHQLLSPAHSNWERFHQSMASPVNSESINLKNIALGVGMKCPSFQYGFQSSFNWNSILHSFQSKKFSCTLLSVITLPVFTFSLCSVQFANCLMQECVVTQARLSPSPQPKLDPCLHQYFPTVTRFLPGPACMPLPGGWHSGLIPLGASSKQI